MAESVERSRPRGSDGDGGGAAVVPVAVEVAREMPHGALQTHQIEMRLGSAAPALTASQAACIEALRKGAASKSQIAVAAGLTHYKARSALLSLAGLRLAEMTPGNRWRLTRRGRTGRFETIPDRNGRGAGKLGRAAKRALQALDRPMTRNELASRLGVTRQRAAQLVVELRAAGQVRLGDRDGTGIVARTDDPTPLLSREEMRVLSVLPEGYATTADKIRQAGKCRENAAARILARLGELGLVAVEEKAAGGKVYRLTQAGSAHPQGGRLAGRAAPPTLPVRSDRVCAVLVLLAARGRARITEVRDALGVEHRSMNALFQYLKRKALVRKDGEDIRSPYVLTAHGREVLAEMQRRWAA